MSDLLEGAAWTCAAARPDRPDRPDPSLLACLEWMPTTVPGTAAGALRAAGTPNVAARDLDAEDWWFRCRFEGKPGTWRLILDGVATLADVWLNDTLVTRTENMFVRSVVALPELETHNELLIRCRALEGALGERRPRPRWKTAQVEHQGLRWFRSSLLGRIPGWARTPRIVGPWKPVRVTQGNVDEELVGLHLRARCEGDGGRIDVAIPLTGGWPDLEDGPVVGCDGEESPLVVSDEGGPSLRASLSLPRVQRWWPHTHGEQPTYEVTLRLGSRVHSLGRVGFRTVEVDRSGGGFTFVVNDEPIFVRGANWFPPDPVTFGSTEAETRRRLGLAADAHLNMVRVPGTTAYPDPALLRGCDELGILIWQDCMFAYMDYPEDEDFLAGVTEELRQAFTSLAPHPAVALVCGNQEVDEIALMNGVVDVNLDSTLFDATIPSLVEELLPETEYVRTNPIGGDPPFRPDTGVSQYFGVGGYLRSLTQLRQDDVRFAAECLALATPPDRAAMIRFGGASLAVHDSRWKDAVHHDPGRSWDMDDVRAHYLRELFGVDPLRERYTDPERALDLGRATNATLVEAVFTEWRCQPRCSGGLVLALNDLAAGAGWGLLDVDGQPKAPWFSLRRASEPLCVRLLDEGLNGLTVHAHNDRGVAFAGRLEVEFYVNGETLAERVSRPLIVEPRRSLSLDANSLFEGFTDLNYAYRFGPPKYDVVVARLCDDEGAVRSTDVFLPLGQERPREADVGLRAFWTPGEPGPSVRVSTERFAQWVSLDVPGFRPSDSWFHLPPGSERVITLAEGDPAQPPRGRVRCLNAFRDAVIRPEEDR